MEKFFAIFCLAITVEGMVTWFNTLMVNGKFSWALLIPIVLGSIVAVVYSLDIYAELGITTAIPYVGQILTGFAVGRGSNYLYDLIGKLTTSTSGGK